MAATLPLVSSQFFFFPAYRHICIHLPIKLTGEEGKKKIDDPVNWRNFPHENESQSIYSKSNACPLTKGPTGRLVCRCCVGTAGMIIGTAIFCMSTSLFATETTWRCSNLQVVVKVKSPDSYQSSAQRRR